MKIQTVAIVGAGVMGRDLALDLACYGYKVLLKDLHKDVLMDADSHIRNNFMLVKMMKPELASHSIEQVLENITLTLSYDGFEQAELVIENITEDWASKKRLYLELRNVCREETIYAVNTSCISITKVASLLAKPDKVLGTHFMNPVPFNKLVEVIKGYHTSEATLDIVKDFLKTLKKTTVVVNDLPGFVTNRVMMLTINESIWTVHDGVAVPQDVDKIFRLGFGHKMGPLATADLIGLDTILNSLMVLYESYNDLKYRPCPLLRKMVDAGLLGKKSGQGFFEYHE